MCALMIFFCASFCVRGWKLIVLSKTIKQRKKTNGREQKMAKKALSRLLLWQKEKKAKKKKKKNNIHVYMQGRDVCSWFANKSTRLPLICTFIWEIEKKPPQKGSPKQKNATFFVVLFLCGSRVYCFR